MEITRVFLKTLHGPYIIMNASWIFEDPLDPLAAFTLPLVGGKRSNPYWWIKTHKGSLIYQEMPGIEETTPKVA